MAISREQIEEWLAFGEGIPPLYEGVKVSGPIVGQIIELVAKSPDERALLLRMRMEQLLQANPQRQTTEKE